MADPAGTTYEVTVHPSVWVPYAAEIAVDFLGWPLDRVIAEFGDTVLIRPTLNGYEFRRPTPAPDSPEVRAQVTTILANARCAPPA
jgi:hypothetical protein